jgi:hypothetical protein
MDQDNDHETNVSPEQVLSPHIDDVKSERQAELLTPSNTDRLLSADRKKIIDWNKYDDICEGKEQVDF